MILFFFPPFLQPCIETFVTLYMISCAMFDPCIPPVSLSTSCFQRPATEQRPWQYLSNSVRLRPRTTPIVTRIGARTRSHFSSRSFCSSPATTRMRIIPEPEPPAPVQLQIDQTTVFSLLGTVAVLAAAYALSLRALPRTSATRARVLFIWHIFDGLIHVIFEGSFLWNCFFVHAPSSLASPSQFLPRDVYFLNLPDRVFGAAYGAGPFSKLWQEYAKADKRWGGSDLTVVSLEILTVFIGSPLALWCAELVRRGEWNLHTKKVGGVGAGDNRKWFWMILLATGELYGGQWNGFFSLCAGIANIDPSV